MSRQQFCLQPHFNDIVDDFDIFMRVCVTVESHRHEKFVGRPIELDNKKKLPVQDISKPNNCIFLAAT